MNNCIFCQIIQRKIAAYVIYENDYIVAVLDAFPVERGHTLILTKTCKKNLTELSRQEIGEIGEAQKKITQILSAKLGALGFNLVNNFNRIAGQQIDHYHLHVIPKYKAEQGFETCHRIPKINIKETWKDLQK